MKKNIPVIIAITLTASLLNACGASSAATKPSNSSVVEKKAERAGNRATNRVDQNTNRAIDRAVDNIFRKIY
jgi:CHASE1-domain containing sensor protein